MLGEPGVLRKDLYSGSNIRYSAGCERMKELITDLRMRAGTYPPPPMLRKEKFESVIG